MAQREGVIRAGRCVGDANIALRPTTTEYGRSLRQSSYRRPSMLPFGSPVSGRTSAVPSNRASGPGHGTTSTHASLARSPADRGIYAKKLGAHRPLATSYGLECDVGLPPFLHAAPKAR